MIRVVRLSFLVFVLTLFVVSAADTVSPEQVVKRPWTEGLSAHFRVYSDAPNRWVTQLVERLEQFRQAYSLLAGAQAVESAPIIVVAFPDHTELKPFLPLYQGKPALISAFFIRASDENLIVLSFSSMTTGSMDVIYHEYSHLLLRHNQLIWPLWLNEGMAEIYGSFELIGGKTARIGNVQPHHLNTLKNHPLIPLSQLFSVDTTSADYNERTRQGVFYAESWLLTHFLMLGENGALRPGLSQFSALLKSGQSATEAFTNAFHFSLDTGDRNLAKYLEKAKFSSVEFSLPQDVRGAQSCTFRPLAHVETLFHLGDELMRVRQYDTAEAYFKKAAMLAPRSPLPFQGLGELAADRKQHQEAVRYLLEARQRGGDNFLVHYTLGREEYELTAQSPGVFARLAETNIAGIRGELEKSIKLAPAFAPAQHLLGFIEMVQGNDLPSAQKHLVRAIALEPENQAYLFSLAQTQIMARDKPGARKTLELLRHASVDPSARKQADQLLKDLQKLSSVP